MIFAGRGKDPFPATERLPIILRSMGIEHAPPCAMACGKPCGRSVNCGGRIRRWKSSLS